MLSGGGQRPTVSQPLVHTLRVRYARMRPPGRRVQRPLPELLRHEHHRAVARRRIGGYQAMLDRGVDIVLAEAQLRSWRRRGLTRSSTLEVVITRLGTTSIASAHTDQLRAANCSPRASSSTCSSIARRSPRRRSRTGCATALRPWVGRGREPTPEARAASRPVGRPLLASVAGPEAGQVLRTPWRRNDRRRPPTPAIVAASSAAAPTTFGTLASAVVGLGGSASSTCVHIALKTLWPSLAPIRPSDQREWLVEDLHRERSLVSPSPA